ncbi:hypothetical protein FB451DRAFT_1189993 [Mycena latifolia]|nr:hypothetical protein FB451DRAFT_1189993 [Mycena latifolia]
MPAIRTRNTTPILRTTGRKDHLTTRKHLDAVAANPPQVAAADNTETRNPALNQQAAFNLASLMLDSDSDDDLNQHRLHSPLQDIMMDGDQFYDADRTELFFSAGTEDLRPERQELIEGIRNLDYYDHVVFGKMGIDQSDSAGDDLTVSNAAAALANLGLESDGEEEEEVYSHDDNDWSPHGSKAMFMLDLLDNLPHLRLSDDQLKTIIWVMRECRTPDVPSFSALRKKQAQLTAEVNIKTRHHVSALGNEFYMNHPAELLALDWANPIVREFIQVYPEITDTISEFIQADKWTKEVDFDDLSPMWADWKNASHKHIYVKELAQLKDGNFVIPIRWVIFKKQEYAEVYTVAHYPVVHQMPNPIRTIAKGRPVFSIRIIPWSDDVSRNVSKQFNPHMNVYMASANLPHRKVSQEYFVCFCSTSPHASSGEQFEALTDDLRSFFGFLPTFFQQTIHSKLNQHPMLAFTLIIGVVLIRQVDHPQNERLMMVTVHSSRYATSNNLDLILCSHDSNRAFGERQPKQFEPSSVKFGQLAPVFKRLLMLCKLRPVSRTKRHSFGLKSSL